MELGGLMEGLMAGGLMEVSDDVEGSGRGGCRGGEGVTDNKGWMEEGILGLGVPQKWRNPGF
jgi:hypothetical protein